MKKLSVIDIIALILLIIGGLNWGLALFDINLVTLTFRASVIVNIIYALVGISAIYIALVMAKSGKK